MLMSMIVVEGRFDMVMTVQYGPWRGNCMQFK